MTGAEQSELRRGVRLADFGDAPELAEIRGATREDHEQGGLPPTGHEELDFLSRLALPHGDDYFCIVAELDDHVVGYLIGGGSRDLDRKAHAEVYELAVLPAFQRRGVATLLLAEALDRFDAAAFAGTLLNAPAKNEAVRRLTSRLEMRPADRDEEHSTIRYERVLRRSSTQRPRA